MKVIISRVCTWHWSDGGGTDPPALAGFQGRVVEIWRCRWLYTEMKVVVCARSVCYQGKGVERVVPFPDIVVTSLNVGCHPINQSPRFQTRTDVAWGRIDEIASDYADQE